MSAGSGGTVAPGVAAPGMLGTAIGNAMSTMAPAQNAVLQGRASSGAANRPLTRAQRGFATPARTAVSNIGQALNLSGAMNGPAGPGPWQPGFGSAVGIGPNGIGVGPTLGGPTQGMTPLEQHVMRKYVRDMSPALGTGPFLGQNPGLGAGPGIGPNGVGGRGPWVPGTQIKNAIPDTWTPGSTAQQLQGWYPGKTYQGLLNGQIPVMPPYVPQFLPEGGEWTGMYTIGDPFGTLRRDEEEEMYNADPYAKPWLKK